MTSRRSKAPTSAARNHAGEGTLSSVSALRTRATRDVDQGAITASYPKDRAAIVKILNDALATELVCVLRYKRHYYSTKGIRAQVAAAEFLEHAGEEQQHADWLAERIVQLGADPDLNPATLVERSHAEYHEGLRLRDMLYADLVAERIAIESYREAIAYVGDRDPTTRRLLETILASEEHHAEDLVDLMTDSPGS
ncbi:MAG: ferritin-like domain-containing protein [Gammaproteobacteria bacterium]